jgi:hypothetical protein
MLKDLKRQIPSLKEDGTFTMRNYFIINKTKDLVRN